MTYDGISRVSWPTRMKVAIRANGLCQYHEGDLHRCQTELARPSGANVYRLTSEATVAHIYSPRMRGPRHMVEEEAPDLLSREWNLLLMCAMHHKEIDSNPEYYTPEMLLEWRDRKSPLFNHP